MSELVRQDIIPVASAYLVLVAMLLAHARSGRADRPARRRVVRMRGQPSVGWGALVGYVVGTAVGGYLLFLLIVVTFYLVLGGEDSQFVLQALREGSVLTFGIVVPSFLVLSWIHQRLVRGVGRWRGSRTTDSGT